MPLNPIVIAEFAAILAFSVTVSKLLTTEQLAELWRMPLIVRLPQVCERL